MQIGPASSWRSPERWMNLSGWSWYARSERLPGVGSNGGSLWRFGATDRRLGTGTRRFAGFPVTRTVNHAGEGLSGD